MVDNEFTKSSQDLIRLLSTRSLSPFDLIPHQDIREKLVDLVLNDVPRATGQDSAALLNELRQKLENTRVDEAKVVVFGGGTGLSNIIGGDCRQKGWEKKPFDGLKRVFPQTRAIVCVTDDGGSTGELLKDFPVFALGDIRHVMLSSIQLENLQKRYDQTEIEALRSVKQLSILFNYRFSNSPRSGAEILAGSGADLDLLPNEIKEYITKALKFCFSDERLRQTLSRTHCLGNLIILATIRKSLPEELLSAYQIDITEQSGEGIYDALSECAQILGGGPDAVLPCTVTSAQLRFHYTDGVQVTGENKSSLAERGFPVDRVMVDFCAKPYVSERVLDSIASADILIMAPGSLYSSIIPVLQVPGIAEAVRNNRRALKLLISNLWVQAGETDRSISDPERKFYVSDMVDAYDSNIPGGTPGLFDHILCLSLHDVPASVIQNYTIEGKIPIYLDREYIKKRGFEPIECGFFSREAMLDRQVIQHDSHVVAQTVKTLFLAKDLFGENGWNSDEQQTPVSSTTTFSRIVCTPSQKYKKLKDIFEDITVNTDDLSDKEITADQVRSSLVEIIWSHRDIPITHFDNIKGVTCIAEQDWLRDQRWDNVFSFYDPKDAQVKIRQDRFENRKNLEIAFLIAVGQSLLGDYAADKIIAPLQQNNKEIGRVYHLHLKDSDARKCYFSDDQLRTFLHYSRMIEISPLHFTRIINGEEGFTPPGLLMGLLYIWYLDNRFASHIEYKMSIMKVRQTDLIPDQKKMRSRREKLIEFFQKSVFGKDINII